MYREKIQDFCQCKIFRKLSHISTRAERERERERERETDRQTDRDRDRENIFDHLNRDIYIFEQVLNIISIEIVTRVFKANIILKKKKKKNT